MAGILEDSFQWSEDPNDADLILYNTCTIRDNAEQKVYSTQTSEAKARTAQPDAGSRWLRRSAGREAFRRCRTG